MPEKLLDYPLTEAKAEIVDGVRETPVQENTSPKGNVVNTVTVSEVKKIVREAIDHFEQEEGGVTEEELNAALATKADKVGVLPHYFVKPTDKVSDFLNENPNAADKAIVLYVGYAIDQSSCYIGMFHKLGNDFVFELESPYGPIRYSHSVPISLSNVIGNLQSNTYKHNYILEQDASKILSYSQGQPLNDAIFSNFKKGDILKVGSSLFLVNTVETTGEGAYKGITGNRIASITSTSITVEYIDWRTVGEGYTELEVKTTTLSIANNE